MTDRGGSTRDSSIERQADVSDSEPVFLGVRKSPPPRADSDTTTIIKSARKGTSGSRNRPKVTDFDSYTKDLLEDAISYYRADINTRNAFPERLDDRDMATSAFVKACSDRNVKVELEPEHMKIVRILLSKNLFCF